MGVQVQVYRGKRGSCSHQEASRDGEGWFRGGVHLVALELRGESRVSGCSQHERKEGKKILGLARGLSHRPLLSLQKGPALGEVHSVRGDAEPVRIQRSVTRVKAISAASCSPSVLKLLGITPVDEEVDPALRTLLCRDEPGIRRASVTNECPVSTKMKHSRTECSKSTSRRLPKDRG